MIRVVLREDVATDDEIPPAFDLDKESSLRIHDAEFLAGDIEQILMIQPVVSLLRGRMTGTGVERRGLKFTDAVSGISVVVPMEFLEAEMLGQQLQEKKVEVFRDIPATP